MDGIVHKNVFAAYTHLHVAGAPAWAEAFVSLARAQRARRPSTSTLVT
jgi:cobyrinic acid a,c-diamide synthase